MMKKLTKLFTAMALSLTCVLNVVAGSSCKDSEVGSGSNSGEQVENVEQIELVKNGTSNYSIVIPEDPVGTELGGASLVKEYIFLSSSYSFKVKDDGDYIQGEKVISFGETTAYKNSGITVDTSTLNGDGFVIKEKDGNLFVIGGTASNSYLYSAQRLLGELVDYEAYYYDEIFYKNSTNITFDKGLDIVDVPWTTERQMFNATVSQAEEVGLYQQVLREHLPIWTNSGNTHTIHRIMPPDEYPQWYSNGEPCWLNEDFQKALAEKSKELIAATPQATNFMIGQPDTWGTWCACEKCAASLAQYGVNSATLIKAINYVADEVKKAIDDGTLNANPDIKITMFTYHSSVEPPVKKDENGNWVPIDESVVCRDNVCVRFAPIGSAYYNSFYEVENEATANQLKGWGALCKNLMIWNYNTNFDFYFVPFCNFDVIQDSYRFLKENNAVSIMEQGGWNSKQTGFWALKNYITAKYQWNTEYNYGELLDNFFNNYYRDGSANVRQYFDEYRAWTDVLCETYTAFKGGVYDRYNTVEDAYPLNLIDRWEGLLNDAKKDIEYLKNVDLELYQKIYDRIDLETLFFDYVRIYFYETKWDDSVLRQMRINFKNKCEHHNITRLEEGTLLEADYAKWGI